MFNKEKIESLKLHLEWNEKQINELKVENNKLAARLWRVMEYLGLEEVKVNEVKIIKRNK